jgi:hypothetical protein
MTPIAIKVVFSHQALLYAAFQAAALTAIFCFVSKLVDLQQARFAVRMTVSPGTWVRNHGTLYTGRIEVG